jgi:hypothetical protein
MSQYRFFRVGIDPLHILVDGAMEDVVTLAALERTRAPTTLSKRKVRPMEISSLLSQFYFHTGEPKLLYIKS